jgi:hypothetical protein
MDEEWSSADRTSRLKLDGKLGAGLVSRRHINSRLIGELAVPAAQRKAVYVRRDCGGSTISQRNYRNCLSELRRGGGRCGGALRPIYRWP